MKTLVKKFAQYMNKRGKAQTAIDLGYDNTATVSAWVHRNKIPLWKIDEVKKLVKKCTR